MYKPGTISCQMRRCRLGSKACYVCSLAFSGSEDLPLETLKMPLDFTTGGRDFRFLTNLLCLSAEVVQLDMKLPHI